MKKENKHDLELASMLVPNSKEPGAFFEELLMEKILHETAGYKRKKQKINRIITVIVMSYISLILLLTGIVLFPASSASILKTPVYELQLNDFTLAPEQLLFYKIFLVVAGMSLLSFGMYFIRFREQQSLT